MTGSSCNSRCPRLGAGQGTCLTWESKAYSVGPMKQNLSEPEIRRLSVCKISQGSPNPVELAYFRWGN